MTASRSALVKRRRFTREYGPMLGSVMYIQMICSAAQRCERDDVKRARVRAHA